MNEVVCNLCGSDQWTVRFPNTLPTKDGVIDVDAFRCTSPGYGEHTQIVTCNRCGYVYSNPRWDDSGLLSAYEAVEDSVYVVEGDGRRLTFRKHLAEIEKLVGPSDGRTLLDVGAYTGLFVQVAQERGWVATGIEPSSWAAAVAQRDGFDVLEGTLDAPALADRQFDVVTMWDVIEHVADPKGELEKAFAKLTPGGLLVVHTMDIDSRLAKVMGKRWPWLMAMHVHYFSKRTLQQMLEQVGYEVITIKPEGRYLRLGYVATRVAGFHAGFGRIANTLIQRLGLAKVAIPLNFGDLVTAYAIRPR